MYKVYGHSKCPYCKDAIRELEKRGEDFTYLDVREDSEALKDYSQYGYRTVPVIVDGEVLVGGFDNLINYLEAKSLGSFDLDL